MTSSAAAASASAYLTNSRELESRLDGTTRVAYLEVRELEFEFWGGVSFRRRAEEQEEWEEWASSKGWRMAFAALPEHNMVAHIFVRKTRLEAGRYNPAADDIEGHRQGETERLHMDRQSLADSGYF
mmetsp:Transcript_6292/g.15650  ORF Transcript_6292/g.15650 Transcript_6292/m.15650 type:complete len:127 (-) Transcript_6292:73-453(-)